MTLTDFYNNAKYFHATTQHYMFAQLYTIPHTHTYRYIHTYRVLSGCKEVENHTSQLAEPCNFPQPHNTTLLHELYLTTTQILEYTAHTIPTHTDLYANNGARI